MSDQTVSQTASEIVRKSPTLDELNDLVIACVDAKVAAGETFSAWNVTVLLRQENQDVDLPHDHVKAAVHYAMVKHLALAGNYLRTFRGFWLYEPVPVVEPDPETDTDEDEDPGGDEEDADVIDFGMPVD